MVIHGNDLRSYGLLCHGRMNNGFPYQRAHDFVFMITSCHVYKRFLCYLLSGEPDYFGRNKISSGGDLSHYSSASLY